jgi:hypothetical protein
MPRAVPQCRIAVFANVVQNVGDRAFEKFRVERRPF